MKNPGVDNQTVISWTNAFYNWIETTDHAEAVQLLGEGN